MGEMADDLIERILDDDFDGWEDESYAGDPRFDPAARTGGMWMTEEEAAQRVSGKIKGGKMTRYAAPDNWTDFEDVEFKNDSAKAILCKFPDGVERWVPISQTPANFGYTVGETGTLTVTEWLANKWDEEGPPDKEPDVEIADCTVMRETAKALGIRVPGHDEMLWFPKTQIREASECHNDGDRGKLVISEWIANQKGLGENAPVSYESVAHDVGRARERREDTHGQDGPAFAPDPDDDDKIPF